jgi:hypothetical protein
MTNTISKLTYTTPSNDDRIASVPLDSSGTVAQTNGGNNSIIIATTKKIGYSALSYSRLGVFMKITYSLFYVDR